MGEKSFRFARNFAWNIGGQAAAAGLNFLVVPFVLHRLGVEAYGLYILMHTTSGYLQLCAMGAGSATTRFTASLGIKALRRILVYSAAAHGLAVLAGAGVTALAAEFLARRLFHVPQPLLEQASFLLGCGAAGAFFLSLTQMSLSTLQGLQRFRWFSLITFMQSSLTPLGAAALIAAGHGLRSIGAWYAVANALCFAAALPPLLAALGEAGPLDEQPRAAEFFGFGFSAWLGSFAWLVSFQADKIFLARGLSLAAVTLYSVPAGLLQRLQTVPFAVAAVTTPMMTELGEAPEDLRRMYLKSLRFLLWAMLPAFVWLFLFMPQFLGLWLHGDFGGRSVWPARLLVLAQVFFLTTIMPNIASFSRGRADYVSAMAWAQAIASVVAWKVLVPRYGLLGVAEGALIGQVVPALFYVLRIHAQLKLSYARYFAEGWAVPSVSALAALAAAWSFHDAATTWPRLILSILGVSVVFYGVSWVLLGREDRELLGKAITRLKARLA